MDSDRTTNAAYVARPVQEFEQAKKEPAATRYDSLPPVPKDRTVAVTVGRWGGFYKMGGAGCWRVCLGFVAITYFRAEFSQVMAAWLDRVEAS